MHLPSLRMRLLGTLRQRARRELPRAHYDYFAGAAGDEQTLAENAAAWRRVWIRPRVMVDVSAVDPSCVLLGRRLELPVLLAPMAAQRLLHSGGEPAAAGGPLWFQLYADRDRAHSERVLARAAEHGYEAVLLTVDLPVGGRRERERLHGEFQFPDGVALTSHLGSQLETHQAPIGGWDASLTWADIAWVRAASGLPVVVKGVLCAEDGVAAVDSGADAIVVSNHGGRQLDGCVPTAVALREVAAAVAGRVPVLVDGGISDGGDVVRALALGADAVMIGRPYAWGLATGGESGVRDVLAAFAEDLRLALALAGCRTLADVDEARVRLAGW